MFLVGAPDSVRTTVYQTRRTPLTFAAHGGIGVQILAIPITQHAPLATTHLVNHLLQQQQQQTGAPGAMPVDHQDFRTLPGVIMCLGVADATRSAEGDKMATEVVQRVFAEVRDP